MAKTKFERIDSGRPDTAVFKVIGKLGFHENGKIKRLVDECLKRNFKHVVFDLSEVSSLGGGVAKIFREFVQVYEEKGNEVRFVVVKDVVNEFLQDDSVSLKVHRSLGEAFGNGETLPNDVSSQDVESTVEESANEEKSETVEKPDISDEEAAAHSSSDADSEIILMSYDEGEDSSAANEQDNSNDESELSDEVSIETVDGESAAKDNSTEISENTEDANIDSGNLTLNSTGTEEPASNESVSDLKGEGEKPDGEQIGSEKPSNSPDEEIISEIFDSSKGKPPKWIDKPVSPFEVSKVENITPLDESKSDVNKQLKRRILELKTLFSISEDFNAIRSKRKLMDIFLLTSIAEGGVESALFFENLGEGFKVSMYKGVEDNTARSLSFSLNAPVKMSDERILSVDVLPIAEDEKEYLKREGLEFACPFSAGEELVGFVVLGRRIKGRGRKDEDFEFLKILVNIARGAYENALMFEREHERTLGIVKTLISLIEENTLLKGTSELVSRYVGMVAKGMGYPDEYFKDLIYGTVLRDMGMIKVSDLILRSPRELTKEEWGIIKRHPEDGAKMLERMRFSDHTIEIVKTHHERFNGEGYPFGLRGREIPLGSRIISVVESYAAMIHERPNRPALSELEAIETLKENYGLRYDREVVDIFSKVIEKELARSAEKEKSLT